MNRLDFKNDQELISQLRKGSPVAFQALFEKYSSKIYRFSVSYLKTESDAEEIVQEVFLKLWENRSRLKSGTSFQSYLFTVALNDIRKFFFKKTRENKFYFEIFETLSAENPDLETRTDFESLLAKLDSLIEQMPPRRKEIFIKKKKEEQAVAEIALEMGISPKTVENQITEAMKFLKKSFEADQISGMLFYFLVIS